MESAYRPILNHDAHAMEQKNKEPSAVRTLWSPMTVLVSEDMDY